MLRSLIEFGFLEVIKCYLNEKKKEKKIQVLRKGANLTAMENEII